MNPREINARGEREGEINFLYVPRGRGAWIPITFFDFLPSKSMERKSKVEDFPTNLKGPSYPFPQFKPLFSFELTNLILEGIFFIIS